MSDFMKTHGRPVDFGGDMRGYDSDKDPHHPDFGLIAEPKKEMIVPTPKKKPAYKSERNLFDLAEKIEVPKPQEKPLDFDKKSKEMKFDKDGRNENLTAVLNPLSALKVKAMADRTIEDIKKIYPDRSNKSDNDIDAVRHALWSYRLTKELGADVAKKFTDAHERNQKARKDSVLMDLENNRIGRILAQDDKNHDRDDIEIIKDALKKGQLRIKPYPVRE